MQDSSQDILFKCQIFVCFLIPFIAAVLTWKINDRARIWFSGGIIYSFFVCFVCYRELFQSTLIKIIPFFILWSYVGILILILKEHLGSSRKWNIILFLAISATALQITLGLTKGFQEVVLAQSILISLCTTYLSYLTYKIYKQYNSLSILIVGISTLVMALSQFLRIHDLTINGSEFNFENHFYRQNLFIIVHLLFVIVLNVGYACFIIENSNFATIQAYQQRDEYYSQKLVAQENISYRDQLLYEHSKFLKSNYTSLIANFINIQLINSFKNLKMLKDEIVTKYGDVRGLKIDLNHFAYEVDSCQSIINSMNNLISQKKDNVGNYDAVKLTNELIPIISNWCNSRNINFSSHLERLPLKVNCNEIIFQKIVLNIIAYIFELFDRDDSQGKFIQLNLELNNKNMILKIYSNSKLYHETLDFEAKKYFDTTKEYDAKIGLIFCNNIIRQWNGLMEVYPIKRKDFEDSEILISLPIKWLLNQA